MFTQQVFVSKSELNGFFETATYLEVFDFNDETKGTSISQTVTSVKRWETQITSNGVFDMNV